MSTPLAERAAAPAADVLAAAARRRSFAIISHPDAGKTTLTEKLLLYAGAVAEAGAVKARRTRRAATSDWMELERKRGISVSSTVLRFGYRDIHFNLLDTPGHEDFSEDTYRVLSAVDSAVMLLDAARGVEAQTLKLFEVCRRRGIPLITFINKYDRPGLEPLELLDEIEHKIGLSAVPLTWPVGIAGDFRGVVDRRDRTFLRFARTAGGATIAPEQAMPLAAAAEAEPDVWPAATEELELLDAVGRQLDFQAFLEGRETPVFFGSAVSNFGVRLLLDALVGLAPSPGERPTSTGEPRPLEAPFSGFVFKLQANLDPRHRDRIAFIRVCSGRFERGMRAVHARTGRTLALNYAHELFGRERTSLDQAFPGDVVGLVNATDLAIGDTIYQQEPVSFPSLPLFAPEQFARVRNRDSRKYKQFRRALEQLSQEGVVHVLTDSRGSSQFPILAGAGPLQFEVASYRFEHEFGAPVELDALDYHVARFTDAAGARMVAAERHAAVLRTGSGQAIAAFPSEFYLARFSEAHPEVVLELVLDS